MSQEIQFPLSTVLYESGWCLIGLWNCVPTDPLWRRENVIGTRPVVALPWTSVVIDRSRRRNELVDPNSAVYYRANEPYERRLISPRGDRCIFISPSAELLHDVLDEAQLEAQHDAFPFTVGPAVSRVTRAQHELGCALFNNRRLNPIEVESSLTEILRMLVGAAGRQMRRPCARPTQSTQRAHRELVHNTKSVLAKSLDDPAGVMPFGIESLGKCVHASPYHLCRVFKRETGVTIGQYWMRLRLRSAAERLVWTDQSITNIAHRFGFSSHAHFTSSWSAEFGSPPSALRQARS